MCGVAQDDESPDIHFELGGVAILGPRCAPCDGGIVGLSADRRGRSQRRPRRSPPRHAAYASRGQPHADRHRPQPIRPRGASGLLARGLRTEDHDDARRPPNGRCRSGGTGREEQSAMVMAADYPFLDALWTMIIFFAWVVYIWMIIAIFGDVFRRRDIGGWHKAAWCVFMIVVPFIGVLTYLIAQHDRMRSAASSGRRRRSSSSTSTSGRPPRAAGAAPRARSRRPSNCLRRARSARPSLTRSRRRRSQLTEPNLACPEIGDSHAHRGLRIHRRHPDRRARRP